MGIRWALTYREPEAGQKQRSPLLLWQGCGLVCWAGSGAPGETGFPPIAELGGRLVKNAADGLWGADPRYPSTRSQFKSSCTGFLGTFPGVLPSAAWGSLGAACCQPWVPCPQGTWVLRRGPGGSPVPPLTSWSTGAVHTGA